MPAEKERFKNMMTGFWFIIGVMCFIALLPIIIPLFSVVLSFILAIIIFAVVALVAGFCLNKLGEMLNNVAS